MHITIKILRRSELECVENSSFNLLSIHILIPFDDVCRKGRKAICISLFSILYRSCKCKYILLSIVLELRLKENVY